MKKRNIIKIVIVFVVASIFILLLVKVSTNIYVGDYSFFPRRIDLQLKIDGELILDDSLHSSRYIPTPLTLKMRYGFHTVSVTSRRANINQENRIFLLPNQYIYVEFLGADTLYLKEKMSLSVDDDLEEDSLLKKYDSNEIIQCYVSTFRIESLFNPFYIE